MLKFLIGAFVAGVVGAQTTTQLTFTDTTTPAIVGNYSLGYVNNTVENRCHIGVAKFMALQTGHVDTMKMGVYSQATQETCGISLVLSTFPGNVVVGSSVLTTFVDLVASRPGTDEMAPFNVTASAWELVAGQNYTVRIQPFTWTTPPAGGVASAAHCVFDIPYGIPGLPYAFIGYAGPTGGPCGSTPLTVNKAGDGWAMQLKLIGRPGNIVVPSPSATNTPTPTSSSTPTPTHTGTPTPSATPTGTPTITDTPTPTLSPGATASNSPTSTRTPSRTPSISYTPSPTLSVTPSVTPSSTPTPTPSLRIGASPSVTPTETPGPTDSPSAKPVAGIAAPASVQAPQTSAGSIVGAALGGAFAVVAIIVVAIRFRIVSAQLNEHKISSWRQKKKSTANRLPQFETIENPTLLRIKRVNSLTSSN
uniref:Uncharacterized protein n=1 Tax=viral metagenome TaxID=1070528 RepID=A0A6C0BBG2_9ZZZZ